jgi:hypothetical protein
LIINNYKTAITDSQGEVTTTTLVTWSQKDHKKT